MIQLTPKIREILERGRTTQNSYFLPKGDLPRPVYVEVNKILANAGGKWDRKTKSHVFDCNPAETLGLVFKTGKSRNREKDLRKMKPETFNRLHTMRMENDAAKYAQEEMRPRFDRLAGRHENGTAPRAVSAFQLFQTPPAVAARLVAAAGVNRSCRVLEPSAGLGRILDALKAAGAWDITAVEMAANIASELYQQERAEVKILQRDFLTVTPEETGLFDTVAMNPPFSMRSDIRHILHACKFLKAGGTLAALCLDTPHREKALRSMSSSWEKLPAETFAKEGTRVCTVLLTIQK